MPITKYITQESQYKRIASFGEVDRLKKDILGYRDIYHDGLIVYLQSREVFD